MAGDWIKFEKTTPDKPEVFEISGLLSIDPDAVIGKLLRVWNWFDDHSKDGHAHVTVMSLLDRYAGVTGFAKAMEQVGWLVVQGDTMILPNFSRHNGEPAKVRALAKTRKQNQRGKCHADGHADGHAGNVTKSGLEKRREESKRKIEGAASGSEDESPQEAVPMCTLEQAKSAGSQLGMTAEESEFYWHSRNKAGWTIGSAGGGVRSPITSWRSDMATAISWVRETMAKAKIATNETNGKKPLIVAGRMVKS